MPKNKIEKIQNELLKKKKLAQPSQVKTCCSTFKNFNNELADAFGEYEREYIPARPGEVRESLNLDKKALYYLDWKPKGDIVEFIKTKIIR